MATGCNGLQKFSDLLLAFGIIHRFLGGKKGFFFFFSRNGTECGEVSDNLMVNRQTVSGAFDVYHKSTILDTLGYSHRNFVRIHPIRKKGPIQ